jgi:hypothetical protein
VYLFIRRGIKEILVITMVHHCYQLQTKLYSMSVKLTPHLTKFLGFISVGFDVFDVADLLLIMCSAFIRSWGKKMGICV